jgi:hypothetical protein
MLPRLEKVPMPRSLVKTAVAETNVSSWAAIGAETVWKIGVWFVESTEAELKIAENQRRASRQLVGHEADG